MAALVTSGQILRAFLVARAKIVAIVAAKIFHAAGASYNVTSPMLTYQSVGSTPYPILDGQSGGIVKERFQLTAWGGTTAPRKSAAFLAATVLQRYSDGGIDGYRGQFAYTDDDGTSHQVEILRLQVVGSQDLEIPPWEGGTKGADGVSIDIELTYRI